MSNYGFSINVSGSMAEVEPKVVAALQAEGFGVLTEIDVKAVMKKKLDLDKRPYKILGACNPVLANQALTAEPDIGLLLPCNIIVREEDDGSVTVGFLDPQVAMALVDFPGVAEFAGEVRTKLERVKDALI